MVEKTLREMRQGGIYDQLGYGFHRYATDSRWRVPHFEKMLYDQALLAMVYTEAYQATGKEWYADTAREIFTYILRDMQAPNGGFYSAEDADSEGEEGKFYLWTWEEVQRVLGRGEAKWVSKMFSIDKDGNFEHAVLSSGKKNGGGDPGKNILFLKESVSEAEQVRNDPLNERKHRLEQAREKLLVARAYRVRPYRDDKQLTDWNGIMIASLAKGGRVLRDPEYTSAAMKATEFIVAQVRDDPGRLLHRYRQGDADIPAMLNDYAFLVWGLIELYETTFQAKYLRWALTLTEEMQKDFWDETHGGFFFTRDPLREQIVRRKEIDDGALPSGNSVAVWNLSRLGRMTNNTRLEEKAVAVIEAFSSTLTRSPSSFSQMMVALEFVYGIPQEVIVVGDSESLETAKMLQTLQKAFLPNKVMLLKPTGERVPEIVQLAGYLQHFTKLRDRTTAYVCGNYLCRQPATDIRTMMSQLEPEDR